MDYQSPGAECVMGEQIHTEQIEVIEEVVKPHQLSKEEQTLLTKIAQFQDVDVHEEAPNQDESLDGKITVAGGS
ncbi:hypothetical protein JX266_013766 [Neoarthrinium moseri]|nr:hypothetical protein JX266_013766 [Neoarthrinium moseri]